MFADSWRGLAETGTAPDWSTFDPVDYPQILAWILLLRPDDDGGLRYAVCGDGCTKILGLSMQGKPFGEDLPTEFVRYFEDEFKRVQSAGAPLYSQGSLPIEDREFIDVFRGVFPFLAADGAVQRFCVVVAPVGTSC